MNWNNAFCRLYGGLKKPPSEDDIAVVKRRVIKNISEGRLFIAPLSGIQEFLREMGLGEMGRFNVTDTSAFSDFEPASVEKLTAEAKECIVRELCAFDYELIEEIEKKFPALNGSEVARKAGLSKEWG